MHVHFMGHTPMGVYQYFLPDKEKSKYTADATKVLSL
jgi:hypothetical protein